MSLTNTNPAINPPICAHQAIPELAPEPVALKNCIKNQNPRKIKAGISTNQGIIMIGITVKIRAFGYKRKYAPITPAMAPLAPMVGIMERGFKKKWNTPEITPQSR